MLQDISWWQTDQGLEFTSQKPAPRSKNRWHRALAQFKMMGKIKRPRDQDKETKAQFHENEEKFHEARELSGSP